MITEKQPEIFVGEESGFISYKTEELSLALNAYGHQEHLKEKLDPRLMGGVPFWMTYKKVPVLPAIPYSHGFSTSGPTKFPLGKRVEEIFNLYIKWKNNPPFASGMLPYLESKKDILIFQGAEEWQIDRPDKESLIVIMSGPLWKISKYNLKIIHISVKKLLNVLSGKHLFSNLELISKTKFNFSRILLINKSFLFFRDKFEKSLDNTYNSLTSFTLRTYGNTYVNQSCNDFFQFSHHNNSYKLILSREKNDYVKLKKNLYSSTGKVCLWEIKNKKRINDGILERIILFKNSEFEPIDEILNKTSEKIKTLFNGHKFNI